MYDRILYPTDGREAAGAVLDHVLAVAAHHGATVHLLYVADADRASGARRDADGGDALEREGEGIVETAAERAADRGVETVAEVVRGEPAGAIVECADSRDADLVAMATHGRRGLGRLLLGSVTERVVRGATVPVLTVRPDGEARVRHPYRSVLVPTDGSRVATAALREAARVADAYDAALHALSVVDPAVLGYDVHSVLDADVLENHAREIVEEAATTAERAGVGDVTTAVASGGPRREIVDYVDEHGIDLLAMGTHGRGGVDRLLLGSLTEKLLRSSPVPVLSVRGGERRG